MKKVRTKRTIRIGDEYEVSMPEHEPKPIKESEEEIRKWWQEHTKDKEAKE